MLCKLSLKRLLYVLFLFSVLISLHVLITVINNEADVNTPRQHATLVDSVEKTTTTGKPVKKYEKILEVQNTQKTEKKNTLNTDKNNAQRSEKKNALNTEKKNVPNTEKIINAPENTIVTTTQEALNNQLPWFFRKGAKQPSKNEEQYRKIWPSQVTGQDRITNQLMYIPENYNEETSPTKTILLWHGLDHWVKSGRASFLEAKCPVNKCFATDDQAQAGSADAILFKDHFTLPNIERPPRQAWIIYLLECPLHTERLQYNDLINWTATYRRDSDIVTPYEKWVYYDDNVKQKSTLKRNFAANKTHLVAWFVSNCNARNGRLNYAHELQKYISVDIFGFCGPLKCPRTQECFQHLDKSYKFYLAFENSNCIDYITEKFFVNALQHDVVPIVMGARPEDYAAVAPYHSYIHVDDFESPKELAEYLLKLDSDDDLYNAYFRWKETGEFINTYFFCRLCAMLHDDYPIKSYSNLNKWWKNISTCVNTPWRKRKKPNS